MLDKTEIKIINELYFKYGVKARTANILWRCKNCEKTIQKREVCWRRNFNECYCVDCVKQLIEEHEHQYAPSHKKGWRWKQPRNT